MKTIQLIAIVFACLSCVSCAQLKYAASVAPDGTKSETATYNTLGGSGSLRTAGGTELVHNHNKSFGQTAQVVGAVAGGVISAGVSKAQEITKQAATASAAKTAQSKIAADAAAQNAALGAKTAVTNKAIDAGAVPVVNPITPP